MLKWISAHYQACRAVTRVRRIDRQVEKFNQVTYGRLNNFSIWLDALAKQTEQVACTSQCTKELADHLSSEIDRLESMIREVSIDAGRIEGKLDGAITQMHNLARAVEFHNGAGKLMLARFDELERRFNRVQRSKNAQIASILPSNN